MLIILIIVDAFLYALRHLAQTILSKVLVDFFFMLLFLFIITGTNLTTAVFGGISLVMLLLVLICVVVICALVITLNKNKQP